MDELKSFTTQCDSWIDGVLESLNWTREGIIKAGEKCVCPVNGEHTMDASALERHLQFCPLIAAGYSKDELETEKSSKFFYENSQNVFTLDLDDATMRNILSLAGGPVPECMPRTNKRSITSLTVPQRLKIYDYCVEEQHKSNIHNGIKDEEITFFDLADAVKGDKPETKLEFLAKMRDLKRRRQSYKGKNAHTGKKNHTEIIRDVLSGQMEVLTKLWEEERQEKEKLKSRLEIEKQHSEKSGSRESSRHKHHRKSRERNKSRKRKISRERHKSHGRQRSQEKRSQEREQSRQKELSQSREQSQEKDVDQEREHDTEREPSRHRHKSKKRHKSKDHAGDSENRKKHKKHKRSKDHDDRNCEEQDLIDQSKDVESKDQVNNDGAKNIDCS